MTSIHTYDLTDGPALPELPPLPIGVLMVGTANCSSRQPTCPSPATSRSADTQSIDLQFAPAQPEHAGHHPVGAPLRQRHDQPARHGHGRHQTWYRTVQLLRHAVTAYAYIPAEPASI